MTRRGHRHPETSATAQLAAEIEWLVNAAGTEWRPRCDAAGAIRIDRGPLPALVRPEFATEIEEILYRPELLPLLRIIEQHNSRPREILGRRLPQKDNFLLGPHLFQVLESVQCRNELHLRLPMLDQPAAEVRSHLQKVAADCKALAELIRKGPEPAIALAGSIGRNELLRVFAVWEEVFEASEGLKYQEVSFADLLERTSGWFGSLSGRVPRAPHNRHRGNGELRMRVAEFLPRVFLKSLGHFYDAHVATIATVVSGLETNADFVRKVRGRQGRSEARAGDTLPRKKGETVT